MIDYIIKEGQFYGNYFLNIPIKVVLDFIEGRAKIYFKVWYCIFSGETP